MSVVVEVIRRWRCSLCGYSHQLLSGETAPKKCYICNDGKPTIYRQEESDELL